MCEGAVAGVSQAFERKLLKRENSFHRFVLRVLFHCLDKTDNENLNDDSGNLQNKNNTTAIKFLVKTTITSVCYSAP